MHDGGNFALLGFLPRTLANSFYWHKHVHYGIINGRARSGKPHPHLTTILCRSTSIMAIKRVQVCEACGKVFFPSRQRNPAPRFCSKKCSYHANLKILACQECGITFHTRQLSRSRFCSPPCRYAFLRRQKRQNRIPEPCLICGVDLYRNRSRKHPNYCSRACYYKSTKTEWFFDILSGLKAENSREEHPPEFEVQVLVGRPCGLLSYPVQGCAMQPT
jgi:hypothetical protein